MITCMSCLKWDPYSKNPYDCKLYSYNCEWLLLEYRQTRVYLHTDTWTRTCINMNAISFKMTLDLRP